MKKNTIPMTENDFRKLALTYWNENVACQCIMVVINDILITYINDYGDEYIIPIYNLSRRIRHGLTPERAVYLTLYYFCKERTRRNL